jgi:hypothetical protein
MQIRMRIRLFNLIRIPFLFPIKVMRICSIFLSIYVSIECVYGPSWLHLSLLTFDFDFELDPHPHPALDFDLDPDPTSQNDADPCESYAQWQPV